MSWYTCVRRSANTARKSACATLRKKHAPGGDHQCVGHHRCPDTSRLQERQAIENAAHPSHNGESPVWKTMEKPQMRQAEQHGGHGQASDLASQHSGQRTL